MWRKIVNRKGASSKRFVSLVFGLGVKSLLQDQQQTCNLFVAEPVIRIVLLAPLNHKGKRVFDGDVGCFLAQFWLEQLFKDDSKTVNVKQRMGFVLFLCEHLFDFLVAVFVWKMVALSGTQFLVTAHNNFLVIGRYCRPEVNYFRILLFVQHYIGRFDITVANVRICYKLKSI